MKVLIVYAHMEPKSFNAALLDTAVKTLTSKGHDVTVSDLYAMKFNPVISRQDTTEDTSGQAYINISSMMNRAVVNQTLAEDIQEEQRKVKEADLIIFQFPLQWFCEPAIMKGWVERVLLNNFAVRIEKFQIYDQGLLAGRKGMLSITTACPQAVVSANGMDGDIRCFLTPLHSTLRKCGIDLLHPNILYSVGSVSAEKRQEMLDRWRERLENIFEEPTGTFPKIADGKELPADYKLPSQSSTEYGASVAQHMGRKIPPEGI